MTRARGLCLLAGVTGMMAAGAPAHAYVRYTTATRQPFAWPQTCVPVTVYPNDLSDLTPDQTIHAVTAAAAAWSAEGDACTFLEINVQGSSAPTPQARFDGRNSVIFRSTTWCRTDDPSGSCTNYDPSALAITSVFVNTGDGKIRDADIEVNARNFVWTDFDLSTDPVANRSKQDLQNALTHEMGHLIGLDHTCYLPGSTPLDGNGNPLDQNGNPLVDNTGAPVPACDAAPPSVQETTMFASAPPDDISKRTLAPDDQQAVCDIYPVASDPKICPTADGGGSRSACSIAAGVGPAGGIGGWGLALGGTLVAWARARRRRRGGAG
jgi:hypothetical protein